MKQKENMNEMCEHMVKLSLIQKLYNNVEILKCT